MSSLGRLPDTLPFTRADLRLPMAVRKSRRNSISGVQSKVLLSIVDGETSSQCLCHLVYKTVAELKKRFRVDVSAGDLVLLKASHGMKLGELIADG